MPFIPVSFWVVVLILMLGVLVLQNATQYTGSDRFADLIGDAGFFIILVVLVVGLVVRLVHYRQSPYVFWRGISWSLAALGCWWLFFRDDSRDPPEK